MTDMQGGSPRSVKIFLTTDATHKREWGKEDDCNVDDWHQIVTDNIAKAKIKLEKYMSENQIKELYSIAIIWHG